MGGAVQYGATNVALLQFLSNTHGRMTNTFLVTAQGHMLREFLESYLSKKPNGYTETLCKTVKKNSPLARFSD